MAGIGQITATTGTAPSVGHLDALAETEGPGSHGRVEKAPAAPNESPQRQKTPLASKIMSGFTSSLEVGNLVASLTESLTSGEATVSGSTSPRPNRSDTGGFTASMAAEIVANDYLAQGGEQEGEQAMEEADEASFHEGSTADMTTISGSRNSSTPEEDALALEVGLNAYDYLEECFYTEVNVLDRDRFDAVPEIDKSGLAILGHLGKGNFSDVFEVVSKTGQLIDSKVSDPRLNGTQRRRGSARAKRSSSLTMITARPPQGGRPRLVFALKCLRPQIRSDADQFTIGAEDLVHETAILANLNHRHIIKLHGRASGHLRNAFLLNDGYFILLDKLEGTLPDRIFEWRRDSKVALQGPTGEQLELSHSIADAMCYLHSKRIIFRDLKPANVGFDSAGVPKLFDFGFAVGLPDEDEMNPSGLLFDRCGTPRYMAPEVGLALGYALPSDVYSFGIIMWEICSLSKPFASLKSSAVFDRRVFMDGLRPQIQSRWPGVVRELMSECWQPRPGRRPTMEVVKSRLSMEMTGGYVDRKAPTKDFLRSRFTRRASDDA